MYVIGFVIAIATCIAITSGAWGSVAVGVVLLLVGAVAVSCGKKERDAYWNAVEYWAAGGPDRKRK